MPTTPRDSYDRPADRTQNTTRPARQTPPRLAGALTRPTLNTPPGLRSLAAARTGEGSPHTGPEQPVAQPDRTTRSPVSIPAIGDVTNGNPLGRAKVDRVDAWFLLDQSRSVFGDHGARFRVAETLLAGIEASGPGARYGVVHWGTEAPPELITELTPINQSASTRRKHLQADSPLGATRIAAPLHAIQDRIGQSQRLERVYVITDGQAQVDQDLRENLAALPAGTVHLLLCDPNRHCGSRREQALRAAGFASVTRLQLNEAGTPGPQLRELLADTIGLTAAERERPHNRFDSWIQKLRRWLGTLRPTSVRELLVLPLAALLVVGAWALSRHHRPALPQPANPARTLSPPARPSTHSRPHTLASTHGHRSLRSGVGMPQTLPGNTPVKPLRIELVLDGLSASVEQHELRALGGWLQTHANPATRITVMVPRKHTQTGPLTATQLQSSPTAHRFHNFASAETQAWSAGAGRRLLITYGSAFMVDGATRPATLHLIDRPGAAAPSQFTLVPGQARTLFIDVRRPRILAATVARAVIAMTHMKPVP